MDCATFIATWWVLGGCTEVEDFKRASSRDLVSGGLNPPYRSNNNARGSALKGKGMVKAYVS